MVSGQDLLNLALCQNLSVMASCNLFPERFIWLSDTVLLGPGSVPTAGVAGQPCNPKERCLGESCFLYLDSGSLQGVVWVPLHASVFLGHHYLIVRFRWVPRLSGGFSPVLSERVGMAPYPSKALAWSSIHCHQEVWACG